MTNQTLAEKDNTDQQHLPDNVGISFGLGSIDSLFDTRSKISYHVERIDGQPDRANFFSKPVVACIAGPDGVGKSILGLTAASTYASIDFPQENDNSKERRVIYASTDLNIDQALSSWKHFGLDKPKLRRERIREHLEQFAFTTAELERIERRDNRLSERCTLNWLAPFADAPNDHPVGKQQLKSYSELYNPQSEPCVNFLDLAAYSAGDDWGLINKIVGLLECRFFESESPHLLIVDAVEGLEAMAGRFDAFGLIRSRRSRLAQLVRLARKANCHVVFVIEQKTSNIHLDEVFVSDLVLRLRSQEKDGYLLKTIEVEKARSVAHVRGVHELQVRDGLGVLTEEGKSPGEKSPFYPDDPTILLKHNDGENDARERNLAYIQVMPSLHQKIKPPSASIAEEAETTEAPDEAATPGETSTPEETAAPGESPAAEETSTPDEKREWFKGLPQLNNLLDRNCRRELQDDQDRIVVSIGESGTLKSRLGYSFLAGAFSDNDAGKQGGAILFTTEGVERSNLVDTAFREWGVEQIEPRHVLVRPILPRFLSSSSLIFRLKTCIRWMKTELNNGEDPFDSTRVRVVIDNWTTILNTHPSLASDPQLLQRVFLLLKIEGVLGYLIGTQPGSPRLTANPQRIHDPAQLEASRVHTWPVDFFGDRRVAVSTSLPGSEERRTAIYELARDSSKSSDEQVDANYRVKILHDFNIYEDLEIGKARRVDLQVKLYSGYQEKTNAEPTSSRDYANEVAALFGDLFPSSKADKAVVQHENIEQYDAFKDYIQNLESSQLSDTLVFQMDEFWTGMDVNEDNPKILANLGDYLSGKSTSDGPSRRDWFLPDTSTADQYRIPLHKDYGLILADRNCWHRAKDTAISHWGITTFFDTEKQKPITELFTVLDNEPDTASILIAKSRSGKNKQVKRVVQSSMVPSSDVTTDTVKNILVGDIWNALAIPGQEFDFEGDDGIIESGIERKERLRLLGFKPSWELFLTSTRVVASKSGKIPFDVDLRTSESLCSLVLEFWLTKIRDQHNYKKLAGSRVSPKEAEAFRVLFGIERSTGKSVFGPSLGKMVELWNKELDYAVRFLIGFLPGRYKEHELRLAPADQNAVAFRTWFAPAVLCQSENRNLTPLRVPGRFSVRGDWRLGVAKGSRSNLLAHKAIDKLVSVPMNRKRLREGIGLPVRNDNGMSKINTALTMPDPSTNSHQKIKYQQILAIEPRANEVDPTNPNWHFPTERFFRSNCANYNRDSGEFFIMLSALLRNVDDLTLTESVGANYNSYEISAVSKAIFKEFGESVFTGERFLQSP